MQNRKINDIKMGIYQINSYCLFGFLEFFAKWENSVNTYYKIFSIPFLRIKKTANKTEFRLFSFLPILKIKLPILSTIANTPRDRVKTLITL